MLLFSSSILIALMNTFILIDMCKIDTVYPSSDNTEILPNPINVTVYHNYLILYLLGLVKKGHCRNSPAPN